MSSHRYASSLSPSKRRDAWFGLAITAPAIILLVLLFVYPIIYSLAISFTNYNYVRGTMKFVGLKNYISAFSDKDFLNSLSVTFLIAGVSIVVQFVFGVMLAIFAFDAGHGKNFFKTSFLVPMMIAPTVAGLLWKFLLNNEFGIVNTWLARFGMPTVPWLVNNTLVKYCVVLADSWACIPFVFLLVYTGLTSISPDMLEAGKIDGGNAWQVFFRIQLPSIRSSLLVTFIIRFMDVFRIYDSIKIMTQGGPGNASETLSLYIYRVNWNKYQMGKASAYSYIMMIIMTIIGLTVQYFGDDKYDRMEKRELRRAARRGVRGA